MSAMPTRQQTLRDWLPLRRRDVVFIHNTPNDIGTTAANPIVIEDDDDLSPGQAHQQAETIVISDDEDTPQPTAVDHQHQALNRPHSARPHVIPPLSSYPLAEWPTTIPRISNSVNPNQIKFIDIDVGACNCSFFCDKDECLNAASAVYCSDANCKVGARCGNRLEESSSVSLMWCSKGYGVVATKPIPRGTTIGEYSGVLVRGPQLQQKQVESGFILLCKSHSDQGEKVYVDASQRGSICRFVNHSCSPNSKFEERSNRTDRRMIIITDKPISPGTEITAMYTEDLLFICRCLEANCVSKIRHNK